MSTRSPILILTSILCSTGALLLLAAVLANLTAANRMMLEDLRVRLRRMEAARSKDAPSGGSRARSES